MSYIGWAQTSISLAWDPSPDQDVNGYHLFYGEVGGVTNKLAVTSGTAGTITGLRSGQTYFAYATAVTADGVESLPSELFFYTSKNAPELAPISDQSVMAGNLLGVQLSATADTSVTLIYSLVSGPAGASVSQAGLFSWTPTEAQASLTHAITVRVVDAAAPTLSDTETFNVLVMPVPKIEPNRAPSLTSVGGQSWSESTLVEREVLSNGSFESTFTGWTYTGNVRICSGVPERVTDGLNSVQFNSGDTAPNGVLRRTFSTVPGLTYTMSFDMGVFAFNRYEQRLRVTVDGAGNLLSETVSMFGAGGGVTTWAPRTWSFVADSTSAALTFADISPTSASLDLLLDHVGLSEKSAPLPLLQAKAGSLLQAQLTASDPDGSLNSLVYSLVAGPAGAAVEPAGNFVWTPTPAQGGSSNLVTVRVTDNGNPSLSDEKQFQVVASMADPVIVNVAPVLSEIPAQVATVGNPIVVQLMGSDVDSPANALTYGLVSGPVGASVDPTTGVFAWIPGAGDAGSVATVEVRVSDNGTPSLSDSKQFTITVSVPNTAPVFAAVPNQLATAGTALALTLSATDADVPANVLRYTLVSFPAGATLDSATGVFRWTPSSAQAGALHDIVAMVTDNGSPSLSATVRFAIFVSPANAAPVIAAIPNQTIPEGSSIRITLSVTDDGGAAGLSYALVSGPAGSTLGTDGIFRWTPTEAQAPSSSTVTVRVTDSGTPALSDTKSFQLAATEVNQAPVLNAIADQRVSPGQVVMVALIATDADLPANRLTYKLISGPSGAVVDASTGVFTWRLAKTYPPSHNQVTVSVTDNGSPALSATKTFYVDVLAKGSAKNLAKLNESGAHEFSWTSELEGARILRFAVPAGADAVAGEGISYLEASEDLRTWTVVGELSGTAELRDAEAAKTSARFYRVRTELAPVNANSEIKE